MKGFNILLVFLFGVITCFGQQKDRAKSSVQGTSVTLYGDEFVTNNVMDKEQILQNYSTMAVSDTLNVQFKTKVKEVCKVKGCWMLVELPEGEQAMVRFKDYEFFMPIDILDKKVVLNGLAYVEEMSVDDQRHYAKDAGKSVEEINQITTPRRTFSFEATGVLIPN